MSTDTSFDVLGMTCGHCEHAVKTELGEIPGVTEVSVTLNPGAASRVTVSSTDDLDFDDIAAAIDEAGYEIAPTS